ncbi:MAG: DUF4397 domain-containing protein [Streptosporangiaceae bacterium]
MRRRTRIARRASAARTGWITRLAGVPRPGGVARPARLAAVLGLALGLIGLAAPAASAAASASAAGSAAGSAAAPAGTHLGWLRLAHLSPNTPAVDVYLYSFGDPSAMIVLKHVTYGTVSGYQAIPSGEYTVAMRGAGAPAGSKPVLSTTVNVVAGKAYTVAGMGPASGLRLQILKDALVTPPGKALVRIIQASLQEHKVTVTAAGKTLARGLPFAAVTAYQAVSPGTWNVHVAGPTESADQRIALAAGTIHTLVVLDDPGRLTIDNLMDAAGSRLLPAGAAATGLGGTAAVPGSSPLPWLVTLAAGLLVSCAGVTLLRRSRAGRA